MTAEWSPWQLHNGKGCPCVGKVVMIERANGAVDGPLVAGIAKGAAGGVFSAWEWQRFRQDYERAFEVVRYKIRKPRALLDMADAIRTAKTLADA